MSQQNDSNNQSNQFGHAAGAIMVVLFIVIIMMIAQESAGVSVAALPRPGFKSPTPTVTSTPTETPMPTATFTPAPTEQPTTEPDANAGASYDPALIAEGESQFILCAACHGLDGRGVPNLGKDLVESEFVAGLTDQELLDFIKVGRPIWDPANTTGVDMPAKGGNPAMTDDQILAVIAYIRSLGAGAPQDAPAEQPATEIPATDVPPTEQPAAQPTAAPDAGSSTSYDPALIAEGESQFILCAACHGMDGHGVPNLGKDLVNSEFVAGLTDQELLDFIKVGRPIWDPANTTGVDMPAKGGNPAMTDDQILAVIAYIRSLGAGAPQDAPADQPATEIPATDVPPTDVPATDVPPTEQPAAQPTAAPDAGSSTSYDPALVAEGESQFILCAACHGMDGHGVPNLGKDLVNSEFVAGLTDQELLDFIKVGRPIWDPANTTGVDMPAKGGNPAMTDDQILAVIAYIRTLSAGQ